MLSPILLAKCLAIGWVPIAWTLFSSSVGATPGSVLTKTKANYSETTPAAQSDRPCFELAPSMNEGRSAQPRASSMPPESHEDPRAIASAPTQTVIATSASAKAIGQPLPGEHTLSDKKLKEPPLETMAPNLDAFLEGTSETTHSAIVVLSPDPNLRSPTPSRSEVSQPPTVSQGSGERQPAPDEVLLSAPSDPELGVIQVADPRRDPELGFLQLRNPLQDPELGILELRQFAPPPPPRPFLFVSAYVSASSSDNVFLVEDPVQGRFGDNFIRPGISVVAFPALGPQTNLLASVETNLLRYQEQSASNYDEIRLRAAVRHRFTDRVYGQVGFSSQFLFDESYDNPFFTNHGIEVTVGRRDPLTPQLTLETFYQGQVFFSDPSEFSNVLNSVGAYLGYRFAPQWDTGIGYRLTISDFTRQNRHETYQRITGQLRYSITPSVRVSLFGGLSYGRSSEDRITFDDSFFGLSFDATIQVF